MTSYYSFFFVGWRCWMNKTTEFAYSCVLFFLFYFFDLCDSRKSFFFLFFFHLRADGLQVGKGMQKNWIFIIGKKHDISWKYRTCRVWMESWTMCYLMWNVRVTMEWKNRWFSRQNTFLKLGRKVAVILELPRLIFARQNVIPICFAFMQTR